MADPLPLAIVGIGRMGALHARVLGAEEGIDVVALVDTRPGVAEAAAADLGAEAYSSVEELAESADLDAWLIATPTPTHPELVELAVGRGLHVFCEKPLSLDVAEHERLGSLAADAGVVLQVGFWRRFSPPWATAHDLIHDGAIGEPLMVRLAQWDANPPPPAFCDPDVSGGLAIDCGVHEYDLAEWLTGRRVQAVTARNLPVVDPGVAGSGDVDNLVALLDLEGGVTATISLTRNARYDDDVRTEILGSNGALFIDLLPEGRARLANSEGVSVVGGSEVADGTAAGVAAQARAFTAKVGGADIEVPGADQSARAVAIGRAVQRAAAGREAVAL